MTMPLRTWLYSIEATTNLQALTKKAANAAWRAVLSG